MEYQQLLTRITVNPGIMVDRPTIRFKRARGIGSGLVLALMLILIIFALGFAYSTFSRSESHITRRMYGRQKLFRIAEAGIDEATLHMRRTINKPAVPK